MELFLFDTFLTSYCNIQYFSGLHFVEGSLVFFSCVSEEEIDYVRILNKVLPKDIRIIGWSPVPMTFHARY